MVISGGGGVSSGRSYGALSNTGTYSMASMERVGVVQQQHEDVYLMERYSPAIPLGGDQDPTGSYSGHQVVSCRIFIFKKIYIRSNNL